MYTPLGRTLALSRILRSDSQHPAQSHSPHQSLAVDTESAELMGVRLRRLPCVDVNAELGQFVPCSEFSKSERPSIFTNKATMLTFED